MFSDKPGGFGEVCQIGFASKYSSAGQSVAGRSTNRSFGFSKPWRLLKQIEHPVGRGHGVGVAVLTGQIRDRSTN